MKEILDIRISEEWAQSRLGPNIGSPMPDPSGLPLPPMLRQIIIEAREPLVSVIGKELLRTLSAFGGNFYYLVAVRREYSSVELERALLFRLLLDQFCIPTWGAKCGTVYDERSACPKCGFGRSQTSPLVLETSLIPSEADIATTNTPHEIVISSRLSELLESNGVVGAHTEPVIDVISGEPSQEWYQLCVTATAGHTMPPTKFGIDFFRVDESGEYTCREHRLSGLNPLTDVNVPKEFIQGADIMKTDDRFGQYAPPFVPLHAIMISARFAAMLRHNDVRGYSIEIGHVV